MLRLRGTTSCIAELFVVQIVQGTGSDIVLLIVIAQTVVPRSELSHFTATQLLIIHLGNTLGSTAAGGIYKSSLRERLEVHFPATTNRDVDEVFNPISELAYSICSPARLATSLAYSDVMRYRTLAAFSASVAGVLLVWWLSDLQLTDKHSLADVVGVEGSLERWDGES